ncbi:interleukin-22 [Odontesthes bonariensis]|uniref:interleukin-22 n=1 Tax=Odontesthes bonariensis TaxID=219752 RepID=UPI003F5871B4
MQLNAITLVSILRPAAAMLAILLVIGWSQQVVAHPVKKLLDGPLLDPSVQETILHVSQNAQKSEPEEDTSIRLIPRREDPEDQEHLTICCLHANILDFYLRNILPHHNTEYPSIPKLRIDLHRVSEDLKTHGCNVTHYHNHHQAVEFRRKLEEMEGERGINKAVGEIDILFTYLYDYCVEPKPAAAK